MRWCSLAMLLALSWPASLLAAEAVPEQYAHGRAQFVTEMVERHGYDRAALSSLLEDARYDPRIIAAMERPFEGKPWAQYRALFVTPERIRAGVEYWTAQAPLLARAHSEYGVAPEIVVAILGVETSYGAVLGRHRAIDALTTLAFAYPPRAAFFRRELEALLRLAREESLDLKRIAGSYAGALGQPQFIPSSYLAYAVDFDGDGGRDLWHSDADIIGSVAHYLARHDWRRDEPVAVQARVKGELPAELPIAKKGPRRPGISPEALRRLGVEWRGAIPAQSPVTLMRLDDEHWLGLQNFFAITRYNHSNLYAMAVFQLGEAIKTGFEDR